MTPGTGPRSGPLLLLLSTASYRASAFVDAAERSGIPLVIATRTPQALALARPDGYLTLDGPDLESHVERAAERHAERPFAAVLSADDDGVMVAAGISVRLDLPHATPEAVALTRDKRALRQTLAGAGVPGPWFETLQVGDDAAARAAGGRYPCVIKPTLLSASRGVMRADDPEGFVRAARRGFDILRGARVPESQRELLVEGYLPGREVAVEGLLTDGVLRVLAVFDKPDPLEGPFFEETIYVTPSRWPVAVLERVAGRTAEMCAAIGLTHGPVHAELRWDGDEVWPVEIAARSIGGLCSRTLRFGGDSLEQLIVKHAIGEDVGAVQRDRGARGVMMLPIPARGILRGVRGVERAVAVPGIEDVRITIPEGQDVVPLPDGDRYLGFVFAACDEPAAAEAALRAAHRTLEIDIRATDEAPV